MHRAGTMVIEARGWSSQHEEKTMRRAVSECGLTATTSVATSASASEPKVSRNNIQVEHIRIDFDKSYGEVRAALEKLPRFDDRIRALLHYIFGMAQRSVAPSATESLVSSATTPGELPSVQGSALIASRPAGRLTTDGYAGFKPPDNGCSESLWVAERVACCDRQV